MSSGNITTFGWNVEDAQSEVIHERPVSMGLEQGNKYYRKFYNHINKQFEKNYFD